MAALPRPFPAQDPGACRQEQPTGGFATAFAQPDHAAAKAQWRLVADQMRPKLPKLATLME
jgi:hypothetical protein